MEKPQPQGRKDQKLYDMAKQQNMEIPHEQKEQQTKHQKMVEKPKEQKGKANNKPVVWDCGSSLYDSFELEAFERQLGSAIASRTLSMPHLSDHRRVDHPQPQPSAKKFSKISRSLHKLLRSVFRVKQSNTTLFGVQEHSQDVFLVVYDTSGALSTIPEIPESGSAAEYDGLSPEIMSSVRRRTSSDRFSFKATSTSIGISCV